jgi:LEA14-like dessication related protein
MFMKSNKVTLSTLLMLLIAGSCSAPRELEYREFRNFTIQKIGFSTTAVKMDMIYFNPNNFGLQLKRTELDIFVNGVLLGHSSQDYQVTIPKKEQFIIPITMDVDMKNLIKNSLISLFNKNVTVKATGSIKVGKANVFMSFPVIYEGIQAVNFFDQ